MTQRMDEDGTRLPIKVDSTSNGEFLPRPLARHNRFANRLALEWADKFAKRRGQSRRAFLTSACGAASTLLAFNHAHAAAGKQGGFYDIAADAAVDPELAGAALDATQFVFDIQGHHVAARGNWRNPDSPWRNAFRGMPQASCDYAAAGEEFGYLDCFSQRAFIKEIFLDSDTDVAVLTFVPTAHADMPLTIDEAAETRAIIAEMEGSKRLLIHGRVIPTLDGDMARIPELAETWNIAAWKTYTQFGPDETGWWLDDDEFGTPFIAAARATGIHTICIHKGLPLAVMGTRNLRYGRCDDVGRAARKHPDMTFIIYHSGFVPGLVEGPFEMGSGKGGVDSLIQSLLDNEIGHGGNVYAELGSTWRYLMREPDQAAHVIGKLLKYVGEDRVVWGTDSIWYGSPQDQIQAFRTFQIAPELREKYGYPEITAAIRDKIFGLNAAAPYGLALDDIRRHAARDPVGRAREAYRESPDPSFLTYGPRNRREFFRLAKATGH